MAEILEGKQTVGGKYVWMPQPGPQTAAITARDIPILVFGGAKYGGKSDFLLGDFLQDVPTYRENWHGVIVRHSIPELDDIIQRSHELFPKCGARWGEQKKTWFFREGSTLQFRGIERESDIAKLQGFSKTYIGLDEVTKWATDSILRKFAIANLRWGRARVRHKRIRMTCNPGGPGHQWVKSLGIDPSPGGYHIFKEPRSEMDMVFIPSRIQNNEIGLENDPDYIKNLHGLGSPELVRAWLEGDWNVVTGAFFPEFGAKHVIRPFTIPQHWTRYRSFDWGSAEPFCCLWIAVADGEPVLDAYGQIFRPQRGSLIVYREWYGMEEGKPNVGLRLRNEQIARGIADRSRNEDISFTVTDSKPFQDDGGISIAEVFARNAVRMRQASNRRRIPGWQQVRSRLQGTEFGPLIYFFDTCVHTIRTLPALQHDDHNPEDIAPMEDHAPDTVRMASMVRPIVRKAQNRGPLRGFNEMTYDDLIEHHELHSDEDE